MTRSERPDGAAMRDENARLSHEVADLKRRIAELEQSRGSPAAQDSHDQIIRQIIDLVPHFLFVKDIDGRFLLVNQATASSNGLTVEEMTGLKIDDFMDDPELVARYRADDLEVIRTGIAKHIAEEPFTDGQGRKRWHQVIKIPYRAVAGDKPAILCISQDITEQKIVREALQESELRLSNHITHTPVAVIVWGLDYAVKEWNLAAEKIFGYSAEEAMGRNAMNLMVPEKDRKNLDGFLRRVHTQEEGVHNTSENVTKDGRTVIVEWYNTPLRDAGGKVTGVAALALDVTDNKRAAESLAESEIKYRSLFETSLDGILFTDTEGIIQEANPAFLHMLGYKIADLIGRNTDDISHSDWREMSRTIRKKILDGPYGQYEKEYLHRDGRRVPVSVHAWPVEGRDDRPGRFMAIVRDITKRKAAESALEESQRLLRLLSENLPAAISYIDRSEHFRFVNKALETWYGRPREDFIGMNIYEIIGEQSLPLWEPHYRRALAGEAVTFDLVRDYPKTGRRTVDITYIPDFASDGHVQGLFGMAQDVTERRAAETALRESEKRLIEAQRIARIGEWHRDLENDTLSYSDNVYEIFGITRQESAPRLENLLPLVHPDDRDSIIKHATTGAREPVSFVYKTRILRPDGKLIHTEQRSEPIFDDAGKVIARRGTVQDITEQTQAEEALRKSEEELRSIYDTTSIGIALTDAHGKMPRTNIAFQRMLGRSADTLRDIAFTEITHAEDRDKDALQFHQVLAGDLPGYHLNKRFLHADGSVVWTSMSVRAMRGADGGVIATIATVEDITERRKVEDQLHQAQKMEAVGQLTGGIAHDFNNLLAVMLGNLELLRDYVSVDGADGKMIDRAVKAAERGAALTNRLLSFSRNQMLQPEVVDLNKLVGGMTDMLRRSLGEVIELDTAFAEALWTSEVDISQLENTILNLAINARDAMPGGGTLTLKTENIVLDEADAAGHAADAEAAAGEYIVLSVSDTGSGMPRDVLERAFEPFFSTKDVGQGSGLGLSMAYGFAQQSGGHITAQSDEGIGTTIRVFLPRSAAHPTANDQAVPVKIVPKARGEKLLVVEDDPEVRALTLDLLRGLGYEAFEAADGKAALEVLQHAPPCDLLLSDVVLPGGMNGRDLAGKIRQLNPAIKVLYMSGYVDSAFASPARAKGDALLLNKPFSKADLANAVRDSLDEEPTRT